jgi:hypothetical protein
MGNEIFGFYQSDKRNAFGFSEEVGGEDIFVESLKDKSLAGQNLGLNLGETKLFVPRCL